MVTKYAGQEIVTKDGVHTVGGKEFTSMMDAMNYAETL